MSSAGRILLGAIMSEMNDIHQMALNCQEATNDLIDKTIHVTLAGNGHVGENEIVTEECQQEIGDKIGEMLHDGLLFEEPKQFFQMVVLNTRDIVQKYLNESVGSP